MCSNVSQLTTIRKLLECLREETNEIYFTTSCISKFTTIKKCLQCLRQEYLAKIDCRYNILCDRCTILYHLQIYGQKHVRMLLNQRDRLLFSIFEGDSPTELLCTLLNVGKPINLKDTNGFNALILLLKQNSHKKLQNLVSDLQINPEPAPIHLLLENLSN